MAKNIKEASDDSLGATIYQGKSLDQWEKEFNGEFTVRQLFQLIRSGVDLGRIKLGLVDEADSINDKQLFKGEEFFFKENETVKPTYIIPTKDTWRVSMDQPRGYGFTIAYGNNKEEAMQNAEQQLKDLGINAKAKYAELNVYAESDEEVPPELNESRFRQPEDVVTVEDFIELLNVRAKPDDKVMFRSDKKELSLFEVESKANIAVIDFVRGKYNDHINENTPYNRSYEQWDEMVKWFADNGHPLEDDEVRLEEFGPALDEVLFKKGFEPKGAAGKVLDGKDAWELYQTMKTKNTLNKKENMAEGRKSWYGGGYGGTGRSWKSLGGKAPRGEEIGWFKVEELDPKAKGKMPGWRCGPAEFPFKDLLYPERKYVKGAMVMRNKYVKAGEMSGEKYIACASYFDALKNNDEEAINLLKALDIPLDLTFGMDPNDDYTNSYVLKESLNAQQFNKTQQLSKPDYTVTIAEFMSELSQISDKWGDDLLVKVVTPEPRREYKDPEVTINSKGSEKVVAIQ